MLGFNKKTQDASPQENTGGENKVLHFIKTHKKRCIAAVVAVAVLAVVVHLWGHLFLPEIFLERVFGALESGDVSEAGTFGDVLGTAMHSKGLAALVTDSGVRDTADLIDLGLPVFSRSVCIKGTVKETLGPINHPIVFGGELVEPGDIVKGDADGVVLVKAADAGWVIEACAEREASEAELRELYRAGGTTIALCNLVEKLAAKGLLVEE